MAKQDTAGEQGGVWTRDVQVLRGRLGRRGPGASCRGRQALTKGICVSAAVRSLDLAPFGAVSTRVVPALSTNYSPAVPARGHTAPHTYTRPSWASRCHQEQCLGAKTELIKEGFLEEVGPVRRRGPCPQGGE